MRRKLPFIPDLHHEVSRSWKQSFSSRLTNGRWLHQPRWFCGAGVRHSPGGRGYASCAPLAEFRPSRGSPTLSFRPSRVGPPRLWSVSPTWWRDRQVRLRTLWPSFRPTKQRYWRRLMRGTVWPPKAFKELRRATDLALCATKHTAWVVGRSMVGLVTADCHLWLNLTEIRGKENAFFLDAPISGSGLFSDAVKAVVDKFRAAKTQAVMCARARLCLVLQGAPGPQ